MVLFCEKNDVYCWLVPSHPELSFNLWAFAQAMNARRENSDIYSFQKGQQTIPTDCDCRCLLVTGYHAASFSTEPIVTCLTCAEQGVVIAEISKVSKELKHRGNERSLGFVGATISTAAAILATGGASEILSGGLGVTTSAYLSVRLVHLFKMLSRVKAFRDTVSKVPKPVLVGCKCSLLPEDMRQGGKCDLTFRDVPDDHIGN